jgi:hypothetical protein
LDNRLRARAIGFHTGRHVGRHRWASGNKTGFTATNPANFQTTFPRKTSLARAFLFYIVMDFCEMTSFPEG